MSTLNNMPPKKAQRLKVIKIPLDYTPEDIPAKFPPMGVLYLELLENKQKIKPELRNVDYVPKNTAPSPELHFEDENAEDRAFDSSYSKLAYALVPSVDPCVEIASMRAE